MVEAQDASAKSAALAVWPEDGERLRRLLLSYMEGKDIGVAALQGELGECAGDIGAPSLVELAAFLTGQTEPSSRLLELCSALAQQVGATDGVAAFGEALAGFGQVIVTGGRLAELSGVYNATASVDVAGNDVTQDSYGTFVFEGFAGRPYLRVRQWEPGDDVDAAGNFKEGVAVRQAHGVSLILREVLTRRLSLLMLSVENRPAQGCALTGVVMTPGFDGTTGRGGVAVNVRLEQVSDGG